ncbi:hypothetical protein OIV83_000372 [Microbotryomycetes sp. JL201]|nr:hypothetical protein OIV83_000372 [Microbotryomycetes sp. JL201]
MSIVPSADTPAAASLQALTPSSITVHDTDKETEATATGAGVEKLARTMSNETKSPRKPRTKDFAFLPIPKRLQYDPDRDIDFNPVLNVVFGFCSTFTVANLYYVHPILVYLSRDFNVSYSSVVNIPTLIQVGYLLGLLFLCPTGDLVRRRPLLLLLVFATSSLTLILALVQRLVAFQVLSFFIGIFSVTPQILLPLSGDLAKPHKRASALSIVFAGLIFGILFARVLSGAITETTNVANVYFMSFGLQVLVWLLVYWFVPDVPAKNKDLGYLTILRTMAKFAVTEPLLVQSCLIGCCSSMIFSAFWVSSTFLLGDEYGYNELQIGLFGLVGVAGVCTAPFVGRLVDKLVPWFGVAIGISINLVTQAVYVGAAGVHIAAVVIVIFLLDIAQQMTQVSNSSAVYGIGDAGRARRSALYVTSIFVGQLVGTAVGTRVFLKGGWRAAGGFNFGLLGLMLLVLLCRGPMLANGTWFGWQGGFRMRRLDKPLESQA